MAFKARRSKSSSDEIYGAREQYKQGLVDGMNKALEYGIKLKPAEKKQALVAARYARNRKFDPIGTHKRMKTERKFNKLVNSHRKLGFL